MLLAALTACTGDPPPPAEAPTPKAAPPAPAAIVTVAPTTELVVTTLAEAEASAGLRARFAGTLQNTKMAPSIATSALSIYCMGTDFDRSLFRTEVEVEGKLEFTDQMSAEGPDGEIRQGVDGSTWMLTDCVLLKAGG